ncbi:MAG: hypothetical protein WC428_02130 [Candidatus Paceibacterota bacterium]|jgi:hypothetical protein
MNKTFYQIIAIGNKKFFDGVGKFHSKKIYSKTPTEEQINEFIETCTNSLHPFNFYDLEKEELVIKIIELQLID